VFGSLRFKNKKIKTEEGLKKKKRRAAKVQKAIVGISLEDLKRKRGEKPEFRAAQRESALREIKERKQKLADSKKKESKGVPKAGKKETKAASSQQKKAPTQKQPKQKK